MMKNRVLFALIPLLFSSVSITSEKGKTSTIGYQSPLLPHNPSITDAPKPHHLTREEQKVRIRSRSEGLKLEGASSSSSSSSEKKNKLKESLLKPLKRASSRSSSPVRR